MQKFIILAAIIGITAIIMFSPQTNHQTPSQLFQQWRTDYGLMLDLTPQEMIYRARIFEKNVQVIEEHNAKPNQNYKLGVNQFTAYTQQEFETMFLSKFESTASVDAVDQPLPKLKQDIDWVAAGAVPPVRNQGYCTATYAFATIGGIEGISAIFRQAKVEYSVQQVIDCSISYGNHGCTTGTFAPSYQYILERGINTEYTYPYRGALGPCTHSTGTFRIESYTSINSCAAMESMLSTRPIPVAVDAQNFKNYHSGIFSNCGWNLSLGALLVGASDQFYRLKNSWGTTWGESGFIRLSRVNNICGICAAGTYPNP